jgi:hypothetical protein
MFFLESELLLLSRGMILAMIPDLTLAVCAEIGRTLSQSDARNCCSADIAGLAKSTVDLKMQGKVASDFFPGTAGLSMGRSG